MPPGVAAHGKDFSIMINSIVLDAYNKTGNWEVNPDIHDVSGSGMDDKKFRGGQVARTMTLGGWTDNSTTTGPRALELLAGQTATFERRPDGIGTGKRKQTGSLVIGKYVETSKNDDIFQWTLDVSITGPVVEGTQA